MSGPDPTRRHHLDPWREGDLVTHFNYGAGVILEASNPMFGQGMIKVMFGDRVEDIWWQDLESAEGAPVY